MRKTLSIHDICYIGISTAIIVAGAQVRIPLPLMPMSLQTLTIQLAGIVLGAKHGAWAVLIYLLLGAAGIPVFAGPYAGVERLVGPSGGFLLTFPFMAFAAGLGAAKGGYTRLFLGLAIGAAVNFICGWLWFSFHTGNPLGAAFLVTVLPFLPLTALEFVFLMAIGYRIHRGITQSKI